MYINMQMSEMIVRATKDTTVFLKKKNMNYTHISITMFAV